MQTKTTIEHAKLKSWVESANDRNHPFPIQNLPYGAFVSQADTDTHIGVAIGDYVLDLAVLEEVGLLPIKQGVFRRATLNEFMALGPEAWAKTRERLQQLLSSSHPELRDDESLISRALIDRAQVTMQLPIDVPGYTDFYSSKEHATNVGKLFRDEKNTLLPNWSELPIAYNGRASSVVVSGTPIKRPIGQIRLPDDERPQLAPCRKLDFELEMAFVVGKPTQLGTSVPCDQAEQHIFGMVLLNDWSARDIQAWEYVPLGPFNSKTFATSISPWVVPMSALEPFRVAAPQQDPTPLTYLRCATDGTFDITLQASICPANSQRATRLASTNFRHLYWTMAQQLAHHTISGCNLRVGDLMGSGTISGPTPDSLGSLLEITKNGKEPVTLETGEVRTFIENHDEVILSGWCQADDFRVGFGECTGRVLPA